MFRSVLIANRGEIAVRIIRTARSLGIRTIAVYSEADRDALHVRLADEAHAIGAAPARESYLNLDRLMEVARAAKAECLHPGYGFLSERAELAEACTAAGVVFVGPPAAAMRAMGLKNEAKALMVKARVPIVPGYHGDNQEPKFLRQKAYEIGYPVLVKAIAGGGGRGMRRVEKALEFEAALEAAAREAQSSFGDARVMIEKYVERPRHVEVQVFADAHGNVVHLYERDCSLQRRHQKVIEEAPAPGITPEVREAMGRAAVEAARAVGYQGAGTVEFLAEGGAELKLDGFWFLEMNTRLQVEHPVTEAITGLDLVEWQFRVAAGEMLPLKQSDIRLDGYAVEARLYAEDPERGFLPSIGHVHALQLPAGEGIRVDTGIESGDEITPYYDPMLAKIIAHGRSREAAFNRLAKALAETVVIGPRTNVAFLRALAFSPEVRQGRVDTGLIERELHSLGGTPKAADHAAAARAVELLLAREQTRLSVRAKARTNERQNVWDTLRPVFADHGRGNRGCGHYRRRARFRVRSLRGRWTEGKDQRGARRRLPRGGAARRRDRLAQRQADLGRACRLDGGGPRASRRQRARDRADARQGAQSRGDEGRSGEEGPAAPGARSHEDGACAHGAVRRQDRGAPGQGRRSGGRTREAPDDHAYGTGRREMTLHLVKLCVGCDSIRDLEEWIAEKLAEKRKKKQPLEHIHRTRMMPTRKDELVDGGSLYWVIRGQVACRQKVLDVRPYTDKEGIKRCAIVLDPKVIPVTPRPSRPFQGWRYLRAKDAPTDLRRGSKGTANLPEELRRELRELGLL